VEVVVGALPHGGEGAVLGAVAAHHDEQRGAALRPVPPEEGDAVHLGHPDVAQDQVERLRLRAPERLLRIAFGERLVARLLEQEGERLAQTSVIVNDQDTHRQYPREAGRL
jgi:hypothetical protein